jgi:tellurite methyltransferase
MSPLEPDELILDIRPEPDFLARHRAGAANIPLESLADRIHELPRRDRAFTVYADDETRARWACSRLRAHGRPLASPASGNTWLEGGPTESGPSTGRLWAPHDLLAEAVGYAQRAWGTLADRSALDIACGTGRDAVYLGLCGLAVEAWDILPDALERCHDLAQRHGVAVDTRCADVERDPTLPAGRYDLVACFNYLHRPLMPSLAGAVRPGGLVAYETFVHPQRELFGKPRRDKHLLRSGELPGFFQGWTPLVSREGLVSPRRFAASLIARKPEGAGE